MNYLVKILADEDGLQIESPLWHIIDPAIGDGAARVLCSGEVFGHAEGRAVAETKTVRRGGITCPSCIERLRAYKSVRL